jgi:hypothetical protein
MDPVVEQVQQRRSVQVRFSAPGLKLFLFWLFALVCFVVGWKWRPYAVPEHQVTGADVAQQQSQPQYHGVKGAIYSKVLNRDDSWTPMRMAIELLRDSPEKPLYSTIFERRIKFQYAPTSLLGLEALGAVFGEAALTNVALNLLGILLLPIVFWCVYALCRPILPPLRVAPLDHALPFLFTALCYPMLKSVELGQIQTHLNALFCLAVLLYVGGRTATAGVIIGLIATIKPQLGLFLVWAVLQKEYRFAKAMGICVGVAGVASLLRYGLTPHLEYLGVLSEISRRGESYYANQSLNGLLLRALHLGPNLEFSYGVFAPYSPWVRYPTLLATLLLIGLALWRFPGSSAHRGVNFVLAAMCFTIGSPVAWQHHYGIAPAVFAVCIVAMSKQELPASAWVVLGVAWLLVGTRVAATAALADTPLNFLQSYTFFGGLLLLALLHVLRVRAVRRSDVPIAAAASP